MKKPFIIILALALTLVMGLAVSLAACTDLQSSDTEDVVDQLVEQGSDTSLADVDTGPEADAAGGADEADHAVEDGHDADEPTDDATDVDAGADAADGAEDVAEADDGAEESPEYVAVGGPRRYEDNTPYLSREGNWRTDSGAQASGGTMSRPVDPASGSNMEVSFKGTGVQLLCARDNCKGNIYIKLEGESGEVYRYHTVDITTTSQTYQEVIWDSGALPRDLYTVTIWIESKGVWIDAVDIWGDAVR